MKNIKYIFWLFVILCAFSIAFFILCYHTFFLSDDYAMAYDYSGEHINTVRQIIESLPVFYMNWGGGGLCTAIQYIFCGLASNKIVFDLLNTIVFVLFLLLGARLVLDNKDEMLSKQGCLTLTLFSVIAWLLLPAPNETLFWIVGSIAYLWTTVESMLFIYILFTIKDKNLSIVALVVLGIISFILSSSHVLACFSICCALIIYYVIIHRNELNKNIFVLALSYGIGSAILIFAPGNFVRQAGLEAGGREAFNLYSCIRCFLELKVFYLVLLAMIFWLVREKKNFIDYLHNKEFILLAWCFCVIAYGVIFRPSPRAAFLPEVFSLVILLQIWNKIINGKWRMILAIFLLLCCSGDYIYAYKDVVHQKKINKEFLSRLVVNRGETCFEEIANTHRMANPVRYEKWTFNPITDLYNLDTLVLHPFVYEKIKNNPKILNETNRKGDGYIIDGKIVVRKPRKNVSYIEKICVTVNYSLPKKWHRDIREKLGLFKYNRSMVFHLESESGLGDDYNYFVITSLEGKKEVIHDICVENLN